jgi:hypothetical protein
MGGFQIFKILFSPFWAVSYDLFAVGEAHGYWYLSLPV